MDVVQNLAIKFTAGGDNPLKLRLVMNVNPLRVGATVGLIVGMLVGQGGTAPYAYAIHSGFSLPSGLSLNPDGSIEVTGALTAGKTEFVADVTDSAGPPDIFSDTFEIDVENSIYFTADTPLDGYEAEAYAYQFSVANATGTITWSISSGSLSGSGLSLNPSTGILGGTISTQSSNPTVYTFNVQASDSGTGETIDVPCSIGLYKKFAGPISTLGLYVVAAQFSLPFTFLRDEGTTGKKPFSFYFTSWNSTVSGDPPNTQPSWVTANSASLIVSGIAPSSGTLFFDVVVTDALGQQLLDGALLTFVDKNDIIQPLDTSGSPLGTPNIGTIKVHSSDGTITVVPSNASGNLEFDLSGAAGISLAPIGSSPNADGATLSSGVLNLEPADASHGGVLTSGSQTIGGAKTFSASPLVPTPATGDRSTSAANTSWVQSLFDTQNFKPAAYAATIAALPSYVYANGVSGVGATITGVANGPLTADGVAIVSGERVLVKNETAGNAPYNGLYLCTQTGVVAVSPFILTRDTDMETAGEFVGALVPVLNGTQAGETWVCSTAPTVVGTDNVTFTIFTVPISSPLTTKGDLYTHSTVDARLPVGTNNYMLTPDSAQATGLKWADPLVIIPVFVASGTSHAAGLVPDPGSSAGSTKFLREDATWAVPSGGGGLVKIAQVVCAGSQSTITFSSIPGTYSDLIIKFSGRATGAVGVTSVGIKFNSDGSSGNYLDTQQIFGSATSAGALRTASGANGAFCFYIAGSATATHPLTTATVELNSYASTALEKGFVVNEGVAFTTPTSSGNERDANAGQWLSTSAITRIDLIISTGSFLNGSVATLYGLG